MKEKLLLLITAAALVAAACAAPPTNRTDTNRNGTAESTTTAAAPMTEADAMAKEKAVWAAFEKQDYKGFADMLDAQAVLVQGDGVYDKAGILKGIEGFIPKDVVFSDWKFISLDKDAAVISYKQSFAGTVNGQPMPPSTIYGTSAWVNRNGKWLAIYHQETEVPKTTPPPPPAAKPEKAAPSPTAAATPGTTSSDVEANEKLVWAALKAKNYDAFASYLAPEAIEVEPIGVMDKAGSVKGVQGFDASKAELSEWKTLKFDDDAALVTYMVMVSGPKPEHERHTTIWANRNGKWLAVLHQGTPVRPAAPSPSPSK